MKKLICIIILKISFVVSPQSVAINADGSTPNASAVLDLKSTTQGLLPPRMTAAQRNAIVTPAQGLIIYCTNCGSHGEAQSYNGSAWVNLLGNAATADFVCGDPITFTYNGAAVIYGTVLNTTTSKCWMDRNLGATLVANSSTHSSSYGDLFQWGRGDDGHQIRSPLSATTSTLSSTDQPGHGNFILAPNLPRDWRSGQNTNLWQGLNGINNPCPIGYRLPTETEWNSERLSWVSNNAAGALASPLKLPMSGLRVHHNTGSLLNTNTWGHYWSSTVNGTDSRNLTFNSNSGYMNNNHRADGLTVRCLRN